MTLALNDKKAYLLFIDDKIINILKLSNDKKGRRFNLSNNEIKNNSPELSPLWRKYLKIDDYQKVSSALNKIAQIYEKNVKVCLGILYLLEKVKKDKLPSIFENLLGIQLFESKTIISHLEKEKVISSTID